ncbi:MAG: peptidylprolyl isomerase [Burkholderiaceae bacterium]|jgi:cyclophilin family peptidyl-prolyl cis-trans isomerase|nr:peptidylprolyl isomerase [Burkholderiaceae bacterium]
MPILRRRLLQGAAALLAAATLALPAIAVGQSTAPATGKIAHHLNPRVKFVTTDGDFVVELYPDQAPRTVANFLQYVRDKQYDGTIFHRVIKTFMIQGGGYDIHYQEKPTRAPIKNEADNGLKNTPYTIAMARKPGPDSATAQFFINVADNGFLNYTAPTPQGWGYAVFGKVVDGQSVVDKIRDTPTGPGGPFPSDAPQTPIVIQSVTLLK